MLTNQIQGQLLQLHRVGRNQGREPAYREYPVSDA
jgi:hypothetical protein